MNKQTRVQRCSVCGELGHNKRSCKVKIDEEIKIIEPMLKHDDKTIDSYKKLLSDSDYNNQLDLLNKITNGHRTKIIKKIYECQYLNDSRFNNIDEFTEFFLNNLITKYPEYNLWFENQECCSIEIIIYFIDNNHVAHIPVTAQCGSGKTMLMDCISYNLMKLQPNNKHLFIDINNIFAITGYSSKDWKNDMQNNLNIILPENVFHRDTIKNLKSMLINKPKRLFNSVFFIDEARLVVEENMTIDMLFKHLGLKDDVILQYNIKIFYIDATLDSHNISLEKFNNNVSDIFQMEPGENYIGVNYSHENWLNSIDKYNLKTEVGFKNVFKRMKKLIKVGKNKHLFRITDIKTRNKFIKKINELGYNYYLVDSSNNSNKWGNHTFDDELLYNRDNNTIYILKDMYRCAKRFRLNKYLGIIYEQDTNSDTITTQGLIARFFGYYSNLYDISPFMICNINHFENQIYELENGESHPEYKTKYVKGSRLLRPTWNSELLNTTNNSKRVIKKYYDQGYITSGSICRDLLYDDDSDRIKLLYNNENLMDRCEIFNNLEECNERIKMLTNIDFQGLGHNKYHNKDRVNNLGNLNIFSHMREKKEILDEKWKENPTLTTYQVYHMKDEPTNKYALRWITKYQ